MPYFRFIKKTTEGIALDSFFAGGNEVVQSINSIMGYTNITKSNINEQVSKNTLLCREANENKLLLSVIIIKEGSSNFSNSCRELSV
jgi:hypothetical protein